MGVFIFIGLLYHIMLHLSFFRQQPEQAAQRLALRNLDGTALVNQVLALDTHHRQALAQFEAEKAALNLNSKQIGEAMRSGQTEAAQALKAESTLLKEKVAALEKQVTQAEEALQQLLISIPNAPQLSVPAGTSAEHNLVVRSGGPSPEQMTAQIPHWDVADRLQLIDFALGVKITGAGFPVYKGPGARLQRALIQYFLDFNTEAGYTEFQVPHLVNADSGFGTGQLPDKEGQMYHVGEDDLYLIPTAEVPLTNIFRDVILPEASLPVKMTGYTPCFRREAGSYGKDVRGLNRLHQFDKVEIVQVTTPEQSDAALEDMVRHVEKLVASLGLSYRILKLCGGDMGFASSLTYDFEVWSSAQKRWLEISSVSNFEGFQANRLKLRYKGKEGKPSPLATLNGSALALPRVLAAILEQYQDEQGILVPEVLQPYTRFQRLDW